MNAKIKYINFFKDRIKSYALNFSVETVFNVIDSIPRSTGLWGNNNIILKYFDGNFFSIQLIQLGYSVSTGSLSSNLIGEIEKKNELETEVRIRIKNGSGINVSFFICILGGLIFFGKFLFFHGQIENLLWGILMIAVFPFLLNWYKKITDVAIREYFEEYLFKELDGK